MDEMLDVSLAGGREAPSRARAALHGLNGSLSSLRQSVRLLVSELVANAVQHAGAGAQDDVRVKLESSPSRVRVEVTDHGPGFIAPGAGEEAVEPGFGFALVERLADRWGVAGDADTVVWFEIDRRNAA